MRQNEVSRRDPFAEMMRSWFDRAFTGLPLEEGQQWIGTLALDVFEKDDQLVVKAAIPGVKPEEVDITIQDDVLTIKGESKEDKEIKREDYYLKETRTGSFTRSIRLPADLDLQSAKADFQDGMLTLSIPKSKDVKPSKIKIPVGGSAAPDDRGGQPS